LAGVASQFSSDKSVESIQIIPQIYLTQGKGFMTVEQVAILYDVDVMALVSYDQVAINELNNLSLAYWTIVGALLVPGESTEFQTFVDTAVFDVRSRKLLFRAPGMHSASRDHTAFGFEKGNRKLRTKSFEIASRNMTDNLTKELVLFKQRVKKGEVIKVKYKTNYLSGGGGGGGGGGSVGWFGVGGLYLMLRFTSARE
jgi:rhombotail lipoprotein